MKKITVIIIGAIMMIALCCACSGGSDNGTSERATIGDISFEVPEGFRLDMEACDYNGADVDDYLVYTLENTQSGKMLTIDCVDIDQNVTWEFNGFDTSSVTISDEEFGDIEVVYGLSGDDTEVENPNEHRSYDTGASATLRIDDKDYAFDISTGYLSKQQRNKNKENDFEFEINALKTIIQSIRKKDGQ